MSTPRKSLGSFVSWLRVLDVLGISPDTTALPARVKCPACRKHRLLILADKHTGGQWHYCRDCGSQGDMIQLAAKAWKLDIGAATSKLVSAGCRIPSTASTKEHIDTYMRTFVAKQAHSERFWKQIRSKEALTRPDVLKLARVNRISFDAGVSWDEGGPTQIYGGEWSQQVEAFFAPKATEDRTKNNRSASRMFKGRKWTDVIIVPFYDQPFRIRSFWCIGRDSDVEVDTALKLVEYSFDRRDSAIDLGLAMHPDTLHDRRAVVGIGDPLFYLQMHTRNFHTSSTPLPLVCWYVRDNRARTRWAWKMLGRRKIVIWCPCKTLDPDSLKQAIQIDGYLSGAGPFNDDPYAFREYIYDFMPDDLISHIIKQGRPWAEYVDKMIDDMEDHEVENLFLSLQLSKEKLHAVLARCSAKVRSRVTSVMPGPFPSTAVVFDRRTVEERGDGWYLCDREDELITDGVLRIDRIVHHDSTGKTLYQGRILYEGQEVGFCENRHVIEKNTFSWMQDLLFAKKKGILRYNPNWNKRIVPLAARFHRPTFVEGFERIGWDATKAAFVLPRYGISIGGATFQHKDIGIDDDTPARNLPVANTLLPEQIEFLLGDSMTNRLFWAGWLSSLANILRPAFNRRPLGTIVCGEGVANVAQHVATSMGCLTYPMEAWIHSGKLLLKERLHGWPISLNLSASLTEKTLGTWLSADREDRNCICRATEYQYLSAMLSGGWYAIAHGGNVAPLSASDETNAASILPAYLLDLCGRNLDIRLQDGDFTQYVCGDVVAWLRRLRLDPSTVTAGAAMIEKPSDNHAKAFAGILAIGIRDKTAAVEGKPRFRKRVLGMWQESDGLFVPKDAFLSMLEHRYAAIASVSRVTSQLHEAGVLVGETERLSKAGWLINKAWWKSQLHKRNVGKRLKVVG